MGVVRSQGPLRCVRKRCEEGGGCSESGDWWEAFVVREVGEVTGHSGSGREGTSRLCPASLSPAASAVFSGFKISPSLYTDQDVLLLLVECEWQTPKEEKETEK